jgi:hypothetical protein
MTQKGLAILIISIVVIAAILVAGCTQSSESSPDQGTAAPASPPSQGTGAPAAGSPSQYHGQSFLTNTTLLTAAAQTLGVSESDLATALTPTAGAHMNLTTAAAQLSAEYGTTITAAQLRTALGFPAGGYMHRGNGTSYSGTPPGS